ncbi:hypothetical protein [Edaphobacter flagellatus]|uniref:hypothetical protein n=1 Tax=Edaphobacter flagellatus TaxID=1933044 RepID=UPI0021B2D8F4|nr:hypothetical protein [Edaphobacter flagellatus]
MMDLRPSRTFKFLQIASFTLLLFPSLAFGQQIIQRGPFGKPTQVFDETQQWTTPLLVSSDDKVEIYIPDVTATDWLARNYPDFQNQGTYTLSIYSMYKSVQACRENFVTLGQGDASHMDSCTDIGYRVRQVTVDLSQKSVQLLFAAMVDQDGTIIPASVQQSSTFRTWDQLDATTQKAIQKTNELVAQQMKRYDARIQSTHNPPRTATPRSTPRTAPQ